MSQWSHYHHTVAFSEFLAYKTRVPVRGAILLNQDMDEVVLVKGWKKGASWSFPRGKINKDEKDLDCAAREVYEETGFDIKLAGLVGQEKDMKFIEIPMREQNMRLYVLRGVPQDTVFEPRTRKEISKIEWCRISDLPTVKKNRQQDNGLQTNGSTYKFYMVAPFLGPLKRWISRQRKLDLAKGASLTPVQAQAVADIITEDEGTGIEDHPGVVNGGHRAPIVNAQSQLSDLPEVSETQDASAHLKRLLNIGGGVPEAPTPIHAQSPHYEQTQTKGNALLALLRRGSDVHIQENAQVTSTSTYPDRSNYPAERHIYPPQNVTVQPPYPSSTGPSLQMPTPNHTRTGMGYTQPPSQPHNIPSQAPAYRDGNSHPYLQQHADFFNQLARPIPPQPTSMGPQYQPAVAQDEFNNRHIPSQPSASIPAPYQRTGDPQYSSNKQFPNAHMSVPAASNLPLPRLNQHSLSLLNAFKGENTTKVSPTPGKSPAQPAGGNIPHQDSLLKLLKQRTDSSSVNTAPQAPQIRAELATKPSPVPKQRNVTPSEKRQKEYVKTPVILQKPSTPDTNRAKAPGGKISATLSGPLSLPDFGGISKDGSKRSPRPSPRGSQRNKPPPPQNITILPRPTSQQNEPAPEPKSIPVLPTAAPKQNVKLSELTKPFKPKILRRPDKDDLEASLPTHTVTVDSFSPPSNEPVQEQEEEEQAKPKSLGYDRRPSQTAVQKETLLSLFNKAPTPSASQTGGNTATPPHLVSPLPRSPAVPSPPSSASVARAASFNESRRDSGDRGDGASQQTRAKATSPRDKAFLLNYLEGVAKGAK